MNHPLYIAFIWHHHQPFCHTRGPGSATAQYGLPWARLHGIKDYLDSALLLERYPQLHQTVGFSPALLQQLGDYAGGMAIDPYLAATLTPAEQLDIETRAFIVDRGFDACYRTLVAPHPRYAELYDCRVQRGRAWCLEHWTPQDYSDLLAWQNLAWFDPLFWDEPDIAAWLQRGRGFTLSDRQRIISKQRELIGRIVPQHSRMQAAGQLELIVSPYGHPLLPLLHDTDLARAALPDLPLPQSRFRRPEDVARHLDKARDCSVEYFGYKSHGLWPPELAIAPDILPAIARSGFRWFCSDETVLSRSMQHPFHRNDAGRLREPELLYRPYRLATPVGELTAIFRDRYLSDLIACTYSTLCAGAAADDLLGHLEATARERHRSLDGRPWLVAIALDSSSVWERYDRDGLTFLTALYDRLQRSTVLAPVTVAEYLARFPPQTTLQPQGLKSGSRIRGDLATWIGTPIKNRAWDLLAAARSLLAERPEATEANNRDAWEALYAAEGSDWFARIGAGQTTGSDTIADCLFREHLTAIYRALNHPVPPELRRPLVPPPSTDPVLPQGSRSPAGAGSSFHFAWENAWRIDLKTGESPHRLSRVRSLQYGLDRLQFYLRLDFATDAQPGVNFPSELHLLWFYPGVSHAISPAPIAELPDRAPLNYLFRHHLGVDLLANSVWFEEAGERYTWQPRHSRARVTCDRGLEVALPWGDLPAAPETMMQMAIVPADSGIYRGCFPNIELVPLRVP
ncbi:alpha-amylase/alpha-mannosidase [Rubidibacter lacunae KORDI 51-2]|uniref:Alpha-amylase/alpha-mannosidase n=1 Tax=Rubidibacter lacunae KORDI 51-2 TaxID=582515 RepID=U5DHF6_9CHRO|nr:alpha-amylase/alpha-mannosidase [Rubidibacter lacunae]ERN40009.1 alpha-amylase/alpha-mannosidase [Rubidibacter lacunae KORDI 51-2]